MMSYMPPRPPFNHRSSPSAGALSYPQGQAGDVHYAASSSTASDHGSSIPPFANLAQYPQNAAYAPTPVHWATAQSATLSARQSPHTSYTGSPAPQHHPTQPMPPTQAYPSAINHNGLLRVYSFHPDRGGPGTRVTVRALISPSEPTDPDRSVRILFEESPSMAERITRVEPGSMLFELWVRVPDLGAISTTLRLRAQLCSGIGTVQDALDFGEFEYIRGDSPLPQNVTGERRMREEDDFGDRNVRRAVRLPSVPRFHAGATPRNPSGEMVLQQTPYRGLPATISPASSMGAFQSPSMQGSPMQSTPLMQGGMWAGGGAGPSHHPGMMTPGTLSQQVSLMRTTQIHGGGSLTQSQALGKVTLELQGKLSNMALGWSQEEVAASRRLVQFSRTLEDGILKVQFRPISPADYVHGTVVVSCIYRRDGAPDERDKCYITSVDAIQLLEAIIASPFSVEEKNRIRRNLEGFKPITVSKHKPDQENFFKLIMEFPAPKPRNIEKDVKVFKWEHLEQALHKIIDKYSVAQSVAGVTDASQSLAFREHSESPRADVRPSPTPTGNRVTSGAQGLKAEPVDQTINDFHYGDTYELDDHDSAQPNLGNAFDQYAIPHANDNILGSNSQYSLPAMPPYDTASNNHVPNDITSEVGWNPMDYLADPPPTAGAQQSSNGAAASTGDSQPMYAQPSALSTPQKDPSRPAPSS